ncbi:hypothetical protein D1AOALGA4SA_6464 [Olavius algarvensis Delta 1 endosymbiont]|nr:hypothetical protein D1AOALGA4SA_6464 [Olavius algarvensis Delta 1 endosymbiont]
MDIGFVTALDTAVIICFAVSFFGFKFIPAKHHIIFSPGHKDIKLLKIGSFFFGLGLILLAFQFVIRLVH